MHHLRYAVDTGDLEHQFRCQHTGFVGVDMNPDEIAGVDVDEAIGDRRNASHRAGLEPHAMKRGTRRTAHPAGRKALATSARATLLAARADGLVANCAVARDGQNNRNRSDNVC